MRSIALFVLLIFACTAMQAETAEASSDQSDGQTLLVQSKKKSKRKLRRRKKKMKTESIADDEESSSSASGDDTSAGIRSRQMVSLAGRYGSVIGGFLAPGFEGLYHLNGDLHLGVMVATGSQDFTSTLDGSTTSGNVSVDKALMSYTLAYAQGRFYLANSFFVNGGLGMRTFNSDFVISEPSAGSLTITTEASSVIVQLGIGNIWRFDPGFLIGCEWIGYNQPISSSFSYNTETTGVVSTFSQDVQNTAIDIAKFTAETGAFMALVVSIGWAF